MATSEHHQNCSPPPAPSTTNKKSFFAKWKTCSSSFQNPTIPPVVPFFFLRIKLILLRMFAYTYMRVYACIRVYILYRERREIHLCIRLLDSYFFLHFIQQFDQYCDLYLPAAGLCYTIFGLPFLGKPFLLRDSTQNLVILGQGY
jgi:hypothetical protein